MLAVTPSLEYTADAFAVLTYYKFADDVKDYRGYKKVLRRVPASLLKKPSKEVSLKYPALVSVIKEQLSALDEKEKNKESSPDAVADCFAKIMAAVASDGFEGDKKRIASEAGYHIGRYIYIIDALEDFDKDVEQGLYNPLYLSYGSREALANNLENIVLSLTVGLRQAYNALVLNGAGDYDGIIENILITGGKNKAKEIADNFLNSKR